MRPLFSAASAALLLCVNPAYAHAFLRAAEPAVGSTLRQPPSQVMITFTEAVEPRFSTIAVRDSAGTSVAAGEVHAAGDGARLAIGLQQLLPGTYKVIWHATAVDTHKTEGNFTFTVTK